MRTIGRDTAFHKISMAAAEPGASFDQLFRARPCVIPRRRLMRPEGRRPLHVKLRELVRCGR
jgi:hypothetical protein